MKTFITFNLLIAFGIMKCMKAFTIFLIAVNSICTESCSKDSELVTNRLEKIEEQELAEEQLDEKKEASDEKGNEVNGQGDDPDTKANDPTVEGDDVNAQEEFDTQEEKQELQQVRPLKSVEEIQIFPKHHPLNQSIAQSKIDVNSNAILQNIGLDVNVFADFGGDIWKGGRIGIPYVAVGKDQPKVPITYRGNDIDDNYGHESEPGPFPIPLDAPKEADFYRDGHVIAVDVDNGMLYELYNAEQKGDGWEASSAAVFNLNTVEFRKDGWTSADAAGLPIFPLLVRYEEAASGEIDHPIRFTLERSKIYEGYVHPARHLIAGGKAANLLPLGGRLRLRADFDISSFSPTNQAILRAMKKYGLMLSDVGPNMYIKGDPNDNWITSDIRELMKVKVSDFDVIELGEIKSYD